MSPSSARTRLRGVILLLARRSSPRTLPGPSRSLVSARQRERRREPSQCACSLLWFCWGFTRPPAPRLATAPTSRPRRSLSSPGGMSPHIVVRMDSFDVVVVAGGPAGEVAAGRLADAGVEGALVGGDGVGGGGSFYAGMPSEGLLRPGGV